MPEGVRSMEGLGDRLCTRHQAPAREQDCGNCAEPGRQSVRNAPPYERSSYETLKVSEHEMGDDHPCDPAEGKQAKRGAKNSQHDEEAYAHNCCHGQAPHEQTHDREGRAAAAERPESSVVGSGDGNGHDNAADIDNSD